MLLFNVPFLFLIYTRDNVLSFKSSAGSFFYLLSELTTAFNQLL